VYVLFMDVMMLSSGEIGRRKGMVVLIYLLHSRKFKRPFPGLCEKRFRGSEVR
jgi:hypothetical protein